MIIFIVLLCTHEVSKEATKPSGYLDNQVSVSKQRKTEFTYQAQCVRLLFGGYIYLCQIVILFQTTLS